MHRLDGRIRAIAEQLGFCVRPEGWSCGKNEGAGCGEATGARYSVAFLVYAALPTFDAFDCSLGTAGIAVAEVAGVGEAAAVAADGS